MYAQLMRSINKRILLVGFAITGMLFVSGVAAAIVVGPCNGSVVIDGTTYTPENDSPANPIVIPDEEGLIAAWSGNTDVVIKDHSGNVGVVVGPSTITLATWSGENADDEVQSNGEYNVDDARELLPFDVVGLYELRAAHSGSGGACTGSAMILIEGNPLATPVGAGAVGGVVLAGAGIVMAGRGRKA